MYLNDERLTFESETHRYTWNDRVLPSVTTMLSAVVPSPQAAWYSDAARERGRFVHAAAGAYLVGDLDLDAVPEGWRGYVTGWARLVEELHIEPLHIEARVCDPVMGYAGTCDLVARLHGGEALLDIKTGPVPDTVGAQTALYARIVRSACDLPLLARGCVTLSAAGVGQVRWLTNDEQDEADALAIVRVFHRYQRDRGRV